MICAFREDKIEESVLIRNWWKWFSEEGLSIYSYKMRLINLTL